VHDRRVAVGPAAGRADREHAHGEVELAPVAAGPRGLVERQLAAIGQPVLELLEVRRERRRQELGDLLADRLAGGHPEQALGRGVPRHDRPAGGPREDRLARAAHDHGEELVRLEVIPISEEAAFRVVHFGPAGGSF
jgi:hypothetical protein